jgi:formyltetrahydrofolate deformylase
MRNRVRREWQDRMVPAERQFILTLSCPDQVGIVARVAGFFADAGGWIVEASNHADRRESRFFLRHVVLADSLPFGIEELRSRFAALAESMDMSWRITDTAERKRLVILVSTQDHCLYDLLGRWKSGELDAEIPCIISNHQALRSVVEWHGIPFRHVPVPAEDRAAGFARLREAVDAARPDAVVLARYMQILPPELCEAWFGRAINIHHSFLPSFAGARAYHQAHERGVKLIGATCHYVTSDLDAGPIIEQDVRRIDHGDTAEDLVRYGRDIERTVLARGLRYHLEDRVLIQGNRTVVFA